MLRSVLFIIALILLLKYFSKTHMRNRIIIGIAMWMNSVVWIWLIRSFDLKIVVSLYNVFVTQMKAFWSIRGLHILYSRIVVMIFSFSALSSISKCVFWEIWYVSSNSVFLISVPQLVISSWLLLLIVFLWCSVWILLLSYHSIRMISFLFSQVVCSISLLD